MSVGRGILILIALTLAAPAAAADVAILCRDAPPGALCDAAEHRVEEALDDLAGLELPDAPGVPGVPNAPGVPDVPGAPDPSGIEVPEVPDPDLDETIGSLPGDPDRGRPCSFLPVWAPLGMPGAAREPLRQAGLGAFGEWWERAGDDLSEPRRFCERI